jgi:hypothetical protein
MANNRADICDNQDPTRLAGLHTKTIFRALNRLDLELFYQKSAMPDTIRAKNSR